MGRGLKKTIYVHICLHDKNNLVIANIYDHFVGIYNILLGKLANPTLFIIPKTPIATGKRCLTTFNRQTDLIATNYDYYHDS